MKKYMTTTGQSTIPEYAKTGLDMANLFGVTQNGDKVDYENFFSTEDKVLCFDDLERANVDVIDIFDTNRFWKLDSEFIPKKIAEELNCELIAQIPIGQSKSNTDLFDITETQGRIYDEIADFIIFNASNNE